VVDTYMTIWDNYGYASDNRTILGSSDDNSGEGSNALISKTPASGTRYWIKVTAKSSTYGTYTFIVE
ncbi:MAG: hypothetical protein LBH25_08725, partial [Fibromonadaceae bacterium]|jgi:hypothetical protein|nr:hypothetical protein [Fibromonadaceae bacterium]